MVFTVLLVFFIIGLVNQLLQDVSVTDVLKVTGVFVLVTTPYLLAGGGMAYVGWCHYSDSSKIIMSPISCDPLAAPRDPTRCWSGPWIHLIRDSCFGRENKFHGTFSGGTPSNYYEKRYHGFPGYEDGVYRLVYNHYDTYFYPELISFVLVVVTILVFLVLLIVSILVYVFITRSVVRYIVYKKIDTIRGTCTNTIHLGVCSNNVFHNERG